MFVVVDGGGDDCVNFAWFWDVCGRRLGGECGEVRVWLLTVTTHHIKIQSATTDPITADRVLPQIVRNGGRGTD